MPGFAQHAVLDFAANVVRLCLWLTVLSAVFIPLERLFFVRSQKVFRNGFATDTAYFFLNGLVTSVVLSLPLSVVAWSARSLLPHGYLSAVMGIPLWLRMLLAMVVGEFGFYWGHRLSHQIPFLWRFHAIHHSAERVDFLVNTRVHPVDLVFTRLCGFSLLYALGLASPVGRNAGLIPLMVLVVGTMWGFFIHANLKWRFGVIEHLIATPAFHHWHHTRTDHKDRNYASMLPWFDRLFGSYHLPKHQWPAEYGIEALMPERLTGQLVHPFLAPPEPDDPSIVEIRSHVIGSS